MTYEVRALSLSEILDQGLRLVRNHFSLILGVGLILYLPLTFLGVLLEGVVEAAGNSPDATMRVAAIGIGMVLLALLLSPIVTAAITHGLGQVYLGREVVVGDCLRRAVSILLPLLGTFLLYSLAVAGGFILLIIPGIYFMLAFMLVNQIVVLEGRFGVKALQRSRDLMRDNIGRGIGVFLASFILTALLSSGVDLALSSIPIVYPIASAVAQAAGFGFYSAVGVLFYFDLRCRKEAFDLEHLSRIVEERSEAPSPAA